MEVEEVFDLFSSRLRFKPRRLVSDGGEEEEEAVGQDGLLAAAQHRGEGRHQEARGEVPQEEGRHHGNRCSYN